jgi:N-acetylmuramoyl-L-alanine amidase
MWLKISNNYSPNFSIPKRKAKMIKFIVIHYTGMKSENQQLKDYVMKIKMLVHIIL